MRVVQRVGSAQDAPVLIDRLESIVREHPYANEFSKAGGRATEEAIHKCLAKVTGRTNPETSREGRVKFLAEVVGGERREGGARHLMPSTKGSPPRANKGPLMGRPLGLFQQEMLFPSQIARGHRLMEPPDAFRKRDGYSERVTKPLGKWDSSSVWQG